MIDLNRKEEIIKIKLSVLKILNMVLEDDLYKREMLVDDLTNLVATLDNMDDRIHLW
ncbi:hypothetical protein [Neobacillus ginsengisoli]|uniref:Uncharacterized protein n=1 Tax=Neobacillus ginsengisoli TaxID=904295 RepID=A0ABT9XNG6_9BACI|nr:hypothetical protein [Neobacillus ginsengisoli]MDQ0197080.1 hypothetical protein [Neobacillus ginsengisoli]